MQQVWFITGSSRGFGRALVRAALDAGDRVVATARQPARLAEIVERFGDSVLPLALDVTDADAVRAAVAAGAGRFGRLDVVVNNAGYANVAPIETGDDADFRAQFETNFWGVYNVSKAVIPQLREQGGGTVVQFSSVGGRVGGSPGIASYQAAKFAVDGFSRVLAVETAPFGVKVIVVEPSGFATDWAGSSMHATVGMGADIPGTTLDHMSSAVPPPGVSIADAVLQEIADGVFAYQQPDGSWWINNAGFLVGPQGVISIDSCSTERRTRAYQEAIATVTTAPVRAVVNTHHHGDHTFGNCMFPGAAIIAQERARAEAIAFGPPRELPFWDGPDWGDLTLDPPFITFTDEIAVHAGDLRAQVRHVGVAAHTTNDSVVWIPEKSVLFCGDLIFNGGTPFLLMGSLSGAVDALEQVVRPLGARTIVPGHGQVFTDAAPIDATLDYLRFVLDVAERAVAAGVPPLEAARETDLGRFAGWADPERIVGNLHRACSELRGTPRGAPIDIAAALTDMVAYNGGQPLTCYA